jgi:fumarylacetoacetase
MVRRPKGIFWDQQDEGKRETVSYKPSMKIDYELEMGYIVSKPVPCGEILDINNAPEHIFGFVLLNDWSARDIQLFEMPPLGPFNSKAFGTTISNWVVTLDALDPFACPPKHEQTNFPLEHLRYADAKRATFDIKVESYLVRNGTRYRLCISNLKYLLWTPFQQITHQASSMCGMRTGDIIGTGTISGDDMENGKKVGLACLYEATQNGTQPVRLDDEQEVIYLKDGDSIILTAYCVDGSGTKILGFGECVGQLLPSL